MKEQVLCSQGVPQEDVCEVRHKVWPDGTQLTQEAGYNWEENERKTHSGQREKHAVGGNKMTF